MLILIISGIIPLILSFWPPLSFYRKPKAIFYAILLIVLIYGSWDIFAAYRGHWHFNPKGVWPVRIINLPLEEVLFFLVIPFACIFTWEAMKFIKAKLK
jgi:lycopene cyclase domain-containing protein